MVFLAASNLLVNPSNRYLISLKNVCLEVLMALFLTFSLFLIFSSFSFISLNRISLVCYIRCLIFSVSEVLVGWFLSIVAAGFHSSYLLSLWDLLSHLAYKFIDGNSLSPGVKFVSSSVSVSHLGCCQPRTVSKVVSLLKVFLMSQAAWVETGSSREGSWL